MKRACSYDHEQQIIYIPVECIKIMLSFCAYETLITCGRVCKEWQAFTLDKNLWPDISVVEDEVNVIDAAVWKTLPSEFFQELPPEQHFSLYPKKRFNVDIDEPELDKCKFFLTLNKIKQTMKNKELTFEGTGKPFTLLTLPKDCSLMACERLVWEDSRLNKDNETFAFYCGSSVNGEGSTHSIEAKTKRILITNNIMRNTRAPYTRNQDALAHLKALPGARLPQAREIYALIIGSCIKDKNIELPYSPKKEDSCAFRSSLLDSDDEGEEAVQSKGLTYSSITYCRQDTQTPHSPGVAGLYYERENDTELTFTFSENDSPWTDGSNYVPVEEQAEAHGVGFVYDI